MEDEVSFGHWLQKRRKALDLTRGELAQKIGYSTSALRKVETDERRPSKQLAEFLADALKIPEDERPVFIKVARGEHFTEPLKSQPPIPDISTLQSSQTISNSIPNPLTPLIGRESELSALHQMLRDPQCRLITLVGPGGIGKTRLAIEAVSLQGEDGEGFVHDVFFVPLTSLRSPNFIAPTIASILGYKISGSTDPATQLLEHLRKKQLLLVLDNFEHLMQGAGLIRRILECAPAVKLLLTSREQLNLRGEWVFEIDGLSVPETDQLDALENSCAVYLFVECAHRNQIGFALTEDNRWHVAKICQLVGGIPLAIELAASWVRILSCQEIAEEIERNLDFLTVITQDSADRHHSMRAVFDHSWKLLSDEERDVLMSLSVFRGGFNREAAEEVTGAQLPLLSMLAAKSLIKRISTGRFDLHELVRQYLAQYLETSGKAELVQHRQITFFIRLAETAKQQFRGPEIILWLDQLEQENDNLRAALDYSINQRSTLLALQLGAAIWRFWNYRGFIAEGRYWLKKVLALPKSESSEDLLYREIALHGAGILARIQGDFAEARNLYEESLVLQRNANDLSGVASALNNLGVVAMFEGQYALAEMYFQESLHLHRELNKPTEITYQLNNLGVLAMYQGDYEKSQLLHEEALAMYREMNDRDGIAGSLGNLGDVFRYQGNYDLAMQVLEQSLAILREIRSIHGMAITLGSIACTYLEKGDIQQARATFRSSLKMSQKVGDKTMIATDLEGIAAALSINNGQETATDEDVQLVVRLLGAANQLRKTTGAPRSAAEQAGVDRVFAQIYGQLPKKEIKLELQYGAAMTTEQTVNVVLSRLSQFSNIDDD